MDANEARKMTNEALDTFDSDINVYVEKMYDKIISYINSNILRGYYSFDCTPHYFIDLPSSIKNKVINVVVEKFKQNNYKIATWYYVGWFKNRQPIYTQGFEIRW